MTAPTPFRPRVEQGSEPLADLPPDQVRRIEEKLDSDLAEFGPEVANAAPSLARWRIILIIAGATCLGAATAFLRMLD